MVKAFAKVRGMVAAQRIDVDPGAETAQIRGRTLTAFGADTCKHNDIHARFRKG